MIIISFYIYFLLHEVSYVSQEATMFFDLLLNRYFLALYYMSLISTLTTCSLTPLFCILTDPSVWHCRLH